MELDGLAVAQLLEVERVGRTYAVDADLLVAQNLLKLLPLQIPLLLRVVHQPRKLFHPLLEAQALLEDPLDLPLLGRRRREVLPLLLLLALRQPILLEQRGKAASEARELAHHVPRPWSRPRPVCRTKVPAGARAPTSPLLFVPLRRGRYRAPPTCDLAACSAVVAPAL